MATTRAKIDEVRVSLTAVIENWLDENELELSCYFGDNTAQIMTTAAVAVLEGMIDSHEYMATNGLVSE